MTPRPGQLALDLADPPRERRRAAPESYHVRSGQTPAEVLEGEARAKGQDERVLRVFREMPRETRLTPSQVRGYLCDECGPAAPLLTSIRRSLTTLTKRGLLVHDARERRPGPHGARESTWGLA